MNKNPWFKIDQNPTFIKKNPKFPNVQKSLENA